MTIEPSELADLRRLAHSVTSKLVGHETAEDVAQEVMVRLLAAGDSIASYRRPWTVRVATNVAIGALRSAARFPVATPAERCGAMTDATLDVDVEHAVALLPERQRQAVILRYLADFDEATVAKLLGCSRGAVKRHLHRAVTTLRRSPLIDRPPSPPPTSSKEHPVRTWRDDFVEAAQPAGGWPARPWDHWYVAAADGLVERLAVLDGEPILDAEGDEVMSGPGFGHAVVKSVPSSLLAPRAASGPLTDGDGVEIHTLVATFEAFPGLEAFLSAASDEAAYHGHPWVGEEHVAIALARRNATFDDRSVAELDNAVAAFYEGPHAAARVRIVEARRGGEPFARQPLASFAVAYSLRLTLPLLANAAARRQLDETAVHLLRRPGRESGVLAGALPA